MSKSARMLGKHLPGRCRTGGLGHTAQYDRMSTIRHISYDGHLCGVVGCLKSLEPSLDVEMYRPSLTFAPVANTEAVCRTVCRASVKPEALAAPAAL